MRLLQKHTILSLDQISPSIAIGKVIKFLFFSQIFLATNEIGPVGIQINYTLKVPGFLKFLFLSFPTKDSYKLSNAKISKVLCSYGKKYTYFPEI